MKIFEVLLVLLLLIFIVAVLIFAINTRSEVIESNLPACEAITSLTRNLNTSLACENSSLRYYPELNMVIGSTPIAPVKEVCIGYCSTDTCTPDELIQYNNCLQEFTPNGCEGIILPIGILNGVTYYPNNIGRSIVCSKI